VRGRFSASPGSLHPFGFRSPSFRALDPRRRRWEIQVHSRKRALEDSAKIAAFSSPEIRQSTSPPPSLSLSLSLSLARSQRGTLIRNVSRENTHVVRKDGRRLVGSRAIINIFILHRWRKCQVPINLTSWKIIRLSTRT